MSCDRFEIDVEMRRHGALDAVEERTLDEHLAGCAGCRLYADEGGTVEASLRASAEEDAAQVDWDRLHRGVLRLRRSYRWKLWLAPLFLLQTPLAFLLATGRAPDPQILAAGMVGNVGLYLAYVWLVNRPLREILRGTRGDLLESYMRELKRQRLRARVWVAINVALTLGCALFAFEQPSVRMVLYALGCATVFVAWAAYDLTWKLPRLQRLLAEVGP
jgi:hypothetical protein